LAGIKDIVPQHKNDSYDGFGDLIDRCNVWLKDRTDIVVINMQSVIVPKSDGKRHFVRQWRTRSLAIAEKRRVSCPHGGGLGPPAHSASTPSGYTYAYGRIRNPQQTYVKH